MSKSFVKFIDVSYSYDTSVNYVLKDVSFHLTRGWTGIIGANGSGKTTLLKLASGLLQSETGSVIRPDIIEYCEQRTDDKPSNLENLFSDYSRAAYKLIDSLELMEEWQTRWKKLSHGERKRCQVAGALWAKPDLLAIDEPTNHLDRYVKEILRETLKAYRGIGLIVSHDRELLDDLCSQCLFVENGSVKIFSGGITEAMEQYEQDKKTRAEEYNRKKEEYLRLKEEVFKRQELAEKNKKQSSKRFLNPKDHDAKSKIDAGRITGKDATGGRLKKQMFGRLNMAEKDLGETTLPKSVNLGISYNTGRSRRNYLLLIESSCLELSENKKLFHDQMLIRPGDRIAFTGPNGSGKSSMLKKIIQNINLESDKLTYIPQEITREETAGILEEIKGLPNKELGRLLIIVSRLGSDAKRILDTELPSPGETRKLLLALGIMKSPELIIMDEPTNHMDLPSIQCLEEALKEVQCALLLVSHDLVFLEKLCSTKWEITDEKGKSHTYTLKQR